MLGFSDLCSFMKTIGIAIKLFHTPARISHEAIPTNPGARNMFVHFPLEVITLKTSLTKYFQQLFLFSSKLIMWTNRDVLISNQNKNFIHVWGSRGEERLYFLTMLGTLQSRHASLKAVPGRVPRSRVFESLEEAERSEVQQR